MDMVDNLPQCMDLGSKLQIIACGYCKFHIVAFGIVNKVMV